MIILFGDPRLNPDDLGKTGSSSELRKPTVSDNNFS